MKFDHTVGINNPLDTLGYSVSREQLWRGLILRAEAPQMFMPHLEACTLTERSELGASRKLDFGTVIIADTVRYVPMERVEYHVPGQHGMPASSLVMSIVEDANGELHVRFLYEDGQPDASGTAEAMYVEFRHSAYKEADLDTIRLIRQMAEEGKLS